MKLLHLADLHLDSPMRGLVAHEGAPESATSFTREAFDVAVGYAIEQAVDLVVIAGDSYDGDWNDFSTGIFLIRQLRRLGEAEIPVVTIWGNHDRASSITAKLQPSLPDYTTLLSSNKPETKIFEDLGVAVHGQSFKTRSVTENLAAHYPARIDGMLNVGVLHTSLAGHAGHDSYAPAAGDDLARLGYDYWALGHIHIRGRATEAAHAYWAGCVQGRSVKETGAHGGLLVTLEPGEDPMVELVDFDALRWGLLQLDCSGLVHRDDLLSAARTLLEGAADEGEGRPVAVRFRLFGPTTLHSELLSDLEKLRAELVLAADNVTGEVWVGSVSVETNASGEHEHDPDVADALNAIEDEEGTRAALDQVVRELVERLPDELLASDGPLAWLHDPESARERVLELGLARLETALAPQGSGGGH